VRDYFPYFCHRSLAEVAETESLLREERAGALDDRKIKRLDILATRGEANNPPHSLKTRSQCQ